MEARNREGQITPNAYPYLAVLDIAGKETDRAGDPAHWR